MKKSFQIKNMVISAVIAALYAVLTVVSSLLGLSSGVIQVRFSEALCILPVFFPAAVPGLCIGCFLANLLTGAVVWDVIFGTLATLLGALGTYCFRKKPVAAFLSPILSNTLIIPVVLKYAYGFSEGIPYFMLTVFAGEVLSVGLFGFFLYVFMKKNKRFLDML